MRSIRWIVVIAVSLALVAALVPGLLVASDHDDGETDTKGRNVNITDVYAFRESDQNPGASANNLILIMNVNPRSVARQQYYFSTNAQYEFKIEGAADVDAGPGPTSGDLATPDVVLRFEFGAPDPATRRQNINLTPVINGVAGATVGAGTTTALNDAPINTDVNLNGNGITVFAGLREDPFFFDVEQFFRVRAGALGFGPPAVFRTPGEDFTAGYNVLSIVVRVPKAFLQTATGGATVYDLWETICVIGAAGCVQVERLAQPAINEGLLVTNEFLNTLNQVGPDTEATLLAALPGGCPAGLFSPGFELLLEAASTLLALGNSAAQACGLAVAFLPDVMRIDTAGPSGYARAANASGRPVRGRRITDDVVDITLSVLVPGSNVHLERDNVSYDGPNRGVTRHKPVLPAFPYLPSPN